MHRIIRITFALIFASFLSFTIIPKADNNCDILHKGTFTYGNAENLIKVIIKGKNHIEYHNNEKYYIKSKLDWVNDCEYNMTLKKVTIPNFPYGKGDIMNVKIDKVKGNQIYYTSTVNGKSWNGIFTKRE